MAAFICDKSAMRDYVTASKQDFLKKHPSVTEKEYDATQETFMANGTEQTLRDRPLCQHCLVPMQPDFYEETQYDHGITTHHHRVSCEYWECRFCARRTSLNRPFHSEWY